MIKATLATLAVMAAVTGPQAQPQTYTAYTPDGAQVVMVSTDPTTYEDDKILTMEEGAEIYICMEQAGQAYTLYTIGPEGVVELWGYGWGTYSVADDIIADWQTWSYPSVAACDGYR